MNKQKYVIYVLWGIFSLCFLWFPCNMFFAVWNPKYMILFGGQGDFPFVQRVLNVAAFVSSAALVVIHYIHGQRRFIEKILLGLAIGGLGALTLSSNFLLAVLDDMEYHKFTSPDAAHTIVIGERSFLLAGGVTVYERKAPFLFEERGSALTDDGYRPICDGRYSLVWRENQVEFSFYNGAGETERIVVDFSE